MVEYLTFDEKDIPTGASLKIVHNCSHLLIATGLKGQLISKCAFVVIVVVVYVKCPYFFDLTSF